MTHREKFPSLALAITALLGCSPPPVTGTDTDTSTDSENDAEDSGVDTDPDSGMDGSIAPDSGDTDTGTGTDTETGSETSTSAGDGTCEPAGTLAVGAITAGTTADGVDDLFDYACAPLAEDGPDVAYEYENTEPAPVLLRIELTAAVDLDLFILLDDCSQDACESFSATGGSLEEATAVVQPGQVAFAVVDSYGVEGDFSLSATASPVEQACSGGVDDDGDGETDCADTDCWGDVACLQSCSQDETLSCFQEVVGATAGWGDDLTIYTGYSSSMSGPDRIFRFQQDVGVEATAILEGVDGGVGLSLLDEACASDAVAAFYRGAIDMVAPASSTSRYLVVDGADGLAGSFTLFLECREVACEGGDDEDGDLASDCDDPDCAADPSCADPCFPLSADAGCLAPADSGVGCFLSSHSTLEGYCHEGGDAGVGGPCEEQHDCVAGAMCTPADVCLMICDLDDGVPGCAEGSCTSIGIDPAGVCW